MTRGNEENGKGRERAFVEAVLDELVDTYEWLAKQWPEKPPEFKAWQGKSCAYMRRMVARLRAGLMESPDPAYTPAQMVRPLRAEFRKAEGVEARLCLREEGDALKERLAKLVQAKGTLSGAGSTARRSHRKLDHALRNLGARRGKRVRTAKEAYEAANEAECAESRKFIQDWKEQYIYG